MLYNKLVRARIPEIIAQGGKKKRMPAGDLWKGFC